MNKVRGLFKVSVNSMLLALLGGFVVLPALSMGLFNIETQQAPTVLSAESTRTSISPVKTTVTHPRIVMPTAVVLPTTLETSESTQSVDSSSVNTQNFTDF